MRLHVLFPASPGSIGRGSTAARSGQVVQPEPSGPVEQLHLTHALRGANLRASIVRTKGTEEVRSHVGWCAAGRDASFVAAVDESMRSGRYTMAAAVHEGVDSRHVRRLVRSHRLAGQSHLHAKSERDGRKKRIIDDCRRSGLVRLWVYVESFPAKSAREVLVHALTVDAVKAGVTRLVVERGDPSRDQSDRQRSRVCSARPVPTQRTRTRRPERTRRWRSLIWVRGPTGQAAHGGRGYSR